MKCGRPPAALDYGDAAAERELADGIHPAVVAARLGTTERELLALAAWQGWTVTHRAHPLPSPERMLARYERLYGFDAW